MAPYIAKRVAGSLLLFWVVTIVTFALIHAAPGGPASLARSGTGVNSEQVEKSLGLTSPIWVQYEHWMKNVMRGNLGNSLDFGTSVQSLIAQRLPNTLLLAAAGLVIGTLVGIALGSVGALRQGTWMDVVGRVFGVAGIAIPDFWLGILLILIFAVKLQWLPAGNMYSAGGGGLLDLLWHLVLPATVIAMFVVANIFRFTRASVISAMGQPYVVTARAKGISQRRILTMHILRNALLPIATILGFTVPLVVGGAVITEVLFDWPGIGNLAVTAAKDNDYPVLMGVTLVFAALVIFVNFATDLCYSLIDPRVRLGEGAER